MFSRRLKTIVFLSVIALMIHGLEELHEGFYETYTLFVRVSHMFRTREQALFVGFQVTWWLVLVLFFALVLSEKWRFRFILVFGLVLLYENQHVYHAIIERRYYPGLISSLLILPLSIAFWREVYVLYRRRKRKASS